MIDFLKNKKYIFLFTSFLISFSFFYFLLYNFPIRFQENDDIVMLLLANSYYTGFFESNLIFIHPFYGHILNFLYSNSNAYEWYTLLFLIFHFISFFLILYNIFNSKLRIVLKVSLTILALSILGNMLAYLQYTTTSFSLALSGIITINFKNKYKFLLGSLLLFIASLIRYEVAILTLLIYSVYFLLISRKKLKQENRSFLYILFLLFTFTIIQKLPRLYSSVEWKSYYTFSKSATNILDNLLADDTESIYSGVCSKEDYRLLKSFYLDKDIVDIDKMKKLSLNVDKKNTLKLYVLNYINQMSVYKIEILIILLMTIFIFFQTYNFNRISIISIFILMFMISFYITMDATLKDRVFIGLVMILISIICNYLSFLSFKSTYVVSILFIILSIYYGNMLVTRINDNRIARFYIYPNSKKIIDEISKKHSRSYISPFSSFFKVELEDPFNISSNFKNNKFYFFGWMSLTPYNTKLDELNKTSNSKKYIIIESPKSQKTTYDLIADKNSDVEVVRVTPFLNK